jgi:hypothetical protein
VSKNSDWQRTLAHLLVTTGRECIAPRLSLDGVSGYFVAFVRDCGPCCEGITPYTVARVAASSATHGINLLPEEEGTKSW